MLVVVEIPHTLPVNVYSINAREQLIWFLTDNTSQGYVEWTQESAMDCYDPSELPGKLKNSLDAHRRVIEVTPSGGEPEYFSSDQESEALDKVEELYFSDLSSYKVLTIEEALEFINSSESGHKVPEAKTSVRNFLVEIGEVDTEEGFSDE